VDVAEPRRPAARSGRARFRRLTIALVAAAPLLTIFFWLCLIYGWEAWGNVAPWLQSDEFERTQLSRAVAATGHEARRGAPHAFDSFYVYLIAPVWWIDSTARAYEFAKAIGVVTMTSVIFPTYLLARMLVSRRWALFAAAGAAMIPALAYSEMLLLEPLAYPWAALCFFLLAKAFATRRAGWIGAAAAACLLAPLVRDQLAVIVGGVVLAAAAFWFVGEGGRRLRRNWTRWDWVGFVVLGVCVLSVLDVIASHRWGIWQVSTQDHKGGMIKDALWAAGSLTIGLGVLPTIAGLASLVKPPGRWPREQRAFAAVAGSMFAVFGVYSAVKGAYVATLGLNELIERNLIYLAPLLFVGTALVLEKRRVRVSALVVATVFALYLVTTTPYHIDIPVFFDAPGLAVLPGLGRAVGLSDGGATVLLVMLTLASAAVLAFVRFTRSTSGPVVAALAAGFVLAWSFYGEVSFARSAHKEADRSIRTMPRPLDWVDRSVPSGTQVYYLGQGIDDTGDILQLEFWNRTVQHVWSVDGTAPGPGPTVVPDVVTPGGRLEPSKGVQYMVADAGISPVGRVIARKIHYGGRGARQWRLIRITPPLRVSQTVEGIYPDGWGKPNTALNQYSIPGNTRSLVKVDVSRTGAAARYPATVVVSVGKLVLTGAPGEHRPAIASVLFTRTLRVPNKLKHVFVFEAPPPPFRVETSVTPFPHERDPTIGDPRDLGANITYTVTS
jgi:hypothetical protein